MIEWSPFFIGTVAVRWLTLCTALTLLGTNGLQAFILPIGLPESDSVDAHLNRWNITLILLLMISTLGELIVRSINMSGGLATCCAACGPVLVHTHFGMMWLARVAALLMVLGISFLPGGPGDRRKASLALLFIIAFTISSNGHAGDQGDFTWIALNNFVHFVAGGFWIGGLFGLFLMAATPGEGQSREYLGIIVPRFSSLAGACLLIVALSGAGNAYAQLPDLSALWMTDYGRVLSLKLLFVAALAFIGAFNRYAIVPYLSRRTSATSMIIRAFRIMRLILSGMARPERRLVVAIFAGWVRRETWLAVIILGLTALLCESMPAIHMGHMAIGHFHHARAHARSH